MILSFYFNLLAFAFCFSDAVFQASSLRSLPAETIMLVRLLP
jgi:hypothetical protein